MVIKNNVIFSGKSVSALVNTMGSRVVSYFAVISQILYYFYDVLTHVSD